MFFYDHIEVGLNFQEKCFEILFQNYLIGKTKVDEPKLPKAATPPTTKPAETMPTTAQIRVFMKRQKITDDSIKEILMYVETLKKYMTQKQLEIYTINPFKFKINYMSETEFRKRLQSGEFVPSWFSFPEVVNKLRLVCKWKK